MTITMIWVVIRLGNLIDPVSSPKTFSTKIYQNFLNLISSRLIFLFVIFLNEMLNSKNYYGGTFWGLRVTNPMDYSSMTKVEETQ